MTKKDNYNAYMKKYMLERYHKRRRKAIAHLGGRCIKCGSSDNLQFDHIERNAKSFEIAKLSSKNEKDFWLEIEKCQLLCNTCHQEKTLIDLGRKSAKNTHGTLSSYRYCKCTLCKKAKADWQKNYKRKS